MKRMAGMLVMAAALLTSCGVAPEEGPAQAAPPTSTQENALDCRSGNWCRYDSQCGADGVCYQGRCACA